MTHNYTTMNQEWDESLHLSTHSGIGCGCEYGTNSMAGLKVACRGSLRLQHALLIALQQLAPPLTNNRLTPLTSWPSTTYAEAGDGS